MSDDEQIALLKEIRDILQRQTEMANEQLERYAKRARNNAISWFIVIAAATAVIVFFLTKQ